MTATTADNALYLQASAAAQQGDDSRAERLYQGLLETTVDRVLQALVANDLGTLAASRGNLSEAERQFAAALELDATCPAARTNLAMVQAQARAVQSDGMETTRNEGARIAIVSFLFNWPSTAGGIIHTVELAQFLQRAGYDVRLFCPRYEPWGIGNLAADCPFPPEVISFNEQSWHADRIKATFRTAVDRFAPDSVILTDCWNFKPHLAEALADYRVLWRMQAQECLCPLNNLRLLPDNHGAVQQCPEQQLASPDSCRRCVSQRSLQSGALHQAERELSGVGTTAYDRLLRKTLQNAAAVLTLNHATAEMFRPHTPNVRVVTWGMDASRFAAPAFPEQSASGRTRLFFAGLVEEGIKGFGVLQSACRLLWEKRQDFELIATGEPAGEVNEFTRYVGWRSQAELPQWYRDTDVTIVPAIAQEGLSRTAVEAFAAGHPVIGSRIGGLAETIEEGVTGLFAEAGDADDLAGQIERLLDDPERRREMGVQARHRFEADFTWETIIGRHYRPLLSVTAEKNSRPTVRAKQSSPVMRLEIGPGEHPLPGFDTIDVSGTATFRARWGDDRLTDVIPAGSCDEVYASHVLEHILWNRTQQALKDVLEILKPGGLFEVWVPDFEYIVCCYQRRACGDDWRRDNPAGDPMLWVNGRLFTYGPGADNLHHACFDYEHLSLCLSRAGFVAIERLGERSRGTSHGPIDLGVTCRRPQ